MSQPARSQKLYLIVLENETKHLREVHVRAASEDTAKRRAIKRTPGFTTVKSARIIGS